MYKPDLTKVHDLTVQLVEAYRDIHEDHDNDDIDLMDRIVEARDVIFQAFWKVQGYKGPPNATDRNRGH